MEQKAPKKILSSIRQLLFSGGLIAFSTFCLASDLSAEPSGYVLRKRPTASGDSKSDTPFESFGFGNSQPTPQPTQAPESPLESSDESPSERVLSVIRRTQEAVDPATAEPTQPPLAAQNLPAEPKQIVKRDPRALLPKDPRFWQWAEWYKEHAVLSLVIDGRDRNHLLENLSKLAELRKKKRVAIGQIVIVGGGQNVAESEVIASGNVSARVVEDPAELRKSLRVVSTPFGDLVDALKVSSTQTIDGGTILSHFDLTSSPAWIVRYQGQDYVYEGPTDIARLFTVDGRFAR